MTQQSSADAQIPDPNADWARAIAEMTTDPEVEVTDVTDVAHDSQELAARDDVPAEGPPEETLPATALPAVAAARRGRRPRAAAVAILGVATIVVGSLGIWAAVAAHGLRASASSANEALVDQSATQSVERAVTSAVNTIFSYSYADTARTRAAAQRLLTGPAIRQYNKLFALVEQQAPKEKLVVTTRVTNIGVELLTGGHARLLVFANQQDSSAGTSKATYGGAMFAVTVVNQHGRWQIESIDTFTGSS
jgi:Mce-associated membrane protein